MTTTEDEIVREKDMPAEREVQHHPHHAHKISRITLPSWERCAAPVRGKEMRR